MRLTKSSLNKLTDHEFFKAKHAFDTLTMLGLIKREHSVNKLIKSEFYNRFSNLVYKENVSDITIGELYEEMSSLRQ